VILSDAYIGNGAEPWKIPDVSKIPTIESHHPANAYDPELGFQPYIRDPETLARGWALPGTPKLEHRIGSLEKQERTGAVSYDPLNHEQMTRERAEKVQRAVQSIPKLEVEGPERGDVLLLGWGSTYGPITTAAARLLAAGHHVSSVNLRHLNPFPCNLEEILTNFKKVLIPENNMGQLCMLIRAKFLVDAVPITYVRGRSFRVNELVASIQEHLEQA